ncbi:hypothetical protein M407DRAFT_211123, partial [Tulasnella calospora MUT 4182]
MQATSNQPSGSICPSCRRRFLDLDLGSQCEKCGHLAAETQGSPSFLDILNWEQCQVCSVSARYLAVQIDQGLKKCEACLKDMASTPGVASMATQPAASSTFRLAASESAPALPAVAAAATAVLRRSEATAVRLRKATPAPTAT